MLRTRGRAEQVDAERADEQLTAEEGLACTLSDIVRRAPPSPPFASYFEAHLQIYLSRLGSYPPR